MASQHRQRSPLRAVLPLLIAGFAATALAIPQAAVAHEADGRPARMHEGSCESLGRVTNQLTGVGAEIGLEGTPIPTPEAVGSEHAAPIGLSTTTLQITTSDLTENPHAIVVYESDEAMDTPLVCGNVGGALMMQMPGMAMPGDELAVWLFPEGESGYTGLALLRSEVGGTSSVTIFLAEGLSSGAEAAEEHGHEATPEATPVAG
jgi:hypothetical protein